MTHMKSHSTNVLTRYPLRRQILALASIASGDRSGIDATGLPVFVQPSSTTAGAMRRRSSGARSLRFSITSPVCDLPRGVSRLPMQVCARPHATAVLTTVVSGGDA